LKYKLLKWVVWVAKITQQHHSINTKEHNLYQLYFVTYVVQNLVLLYLCCILLILYVCSYLTRIQICTIRTLSSIKDNMLFKLLSWLLVHHKAHVQIIWLKLCIHWFFFFNFQNNMWLSDGENLALYIRKGGQPEIKFKQQRMEFTHTFCKIFNFNSI
jgi:hypothetical protein